MTTEKRDAMVDGLGRFVEFLREHPEVPAPALVFVRENGSPAKVRAAVEVFVHGAEGLVTKETPPYADEDFRLIRGFGDFKVFLTFSKEALGCRKVTKMVETTSWECGPILSGIKEKGE